MLIMYSSKNSSNKTDYKMMHHIKSKPIRTEDGRDNLIGMVMKTFNASNSPQNLNSMRKDEHLKQVNDQNTSILEHKTKYSEKTNRGTDVNEKKRVKQTISTVVKNSAKELILPPKKKNTFVCKFCCHPFHSLELLEEHRVTHGSKPDYVCYLCNHQVATFSALMSHYLRHSGNKVAKLGKNHGKSKPETTNVQLNTSSRSKSTFQCPQCKEYFMNKDKLSVHVSVCKKKTEYNCAYCGHISPSVEEYRNHVQSHTVSPFLCRHCKFKAQTKKLLDKHYETCKEQTKPKENISIKCGACKTLCKNKKEFTEHMKTCSEVKNKNEHEKSKHIQNKKKIKKVKPKKLVLKLPAKNKNSVKISKSVEKKENFIETKHQATAQCEKLKKEIVTTQEKPNIIQTSEKSDLLAENAVECASNLQNSIDNTRRSARLVGRRCSFLEDDFNVKRSFKIKAKILNKVKKQKILNKCKGKRGRKPKVKDDSNDFYCSECNFSFCSKSTLLRHQRMHSGDPWFTCKFCGKFFFRKDVYIRHEMNVHSKIAENVFCCYYCKTYFNLSSLLKEHVLAEHKQSAFMPLKLRRPTKNKNQLKKTQASVKQEPFSDDGKVESNEDLNVKNATEVGLKAEKLSLKLANSLLVQNSNKEFKCGVCFKLFANNDDIENHMHMHDEPEKAGAFHKKLEMNVPADSEDNSFPILKKEVETPCKNDLEGTSSENMLYEETFDCMSPPELMKQNVENENENAENCSLGPVDLLSVSGEAQEYLCALCLQKFSNKEHLLQHKSIKHRIIDWYQCLVCSFCGPQQDVIEHMFMHMYKVGTFVISGNNFDSVLPHLTEKFQQNETPEYSSNADKTLEELDSLDDESSIEPNLPPLKEFGFTTVTSKKCEEANQRQLSLPVSSSFQSTGELNSPSCCPSKHKENKSTMAQKDGFKLSQELASSMCDSESVDIEPKNLKDINENCSESSMRKNHTKSTTLKDVNNKLFVDHNFSENSRKMCKEQDHLATQSLNTINEFAENKSDEEKLSVSKNNPFCKSKPNVEKCVLPPKSDRNDHLVGILTDQEAKFSSESYEKTIDNSSLTSKKSNIRSKKTFLLNKKQRTVKCGKESSLLEKKTPDRQDTSFSQLRYLLENFRSEDKSREKQELKLQTESKSESSPLKKILLGKNFENCLQTLPTKEQSSLTSSIPDNNLCVDMRVNTFGALPHLPVETTPNTNRCLKFDINQSCGEFSETSNNAGIQKKTDLFKSHQSQSTILDFSNLLENTTSNENIFECHASSYSNLHDDFAQEKSTEHEVQQSSSSIKKHRIRDEPLNFSRENSQGILDYSKHNLQTVQNFAEMKLNKNSTQNSFTSKKTDIQVGSLVNDEKNKQLQNFTADINSKSTKIEETDEMDLSDGIYDNLPNSAKCSRCHENFNDISEFMRHTPNCVKPLFYENQSRSILESSDTLRSLLEESNANFPDKMNFTNYYNSPYATVSELASENIKNLSRKTFDS